MGAELTLGTVIYYAIYALVIAGGVYYASKAGSQSSSKAEDHGLTINTRDTNEPLKVIYGKQKLGVNDVFFKVTGTGSHPSRYLYTVSTLCEGPIEGIAQDDGANDLIFLGNKQAKDYGADFNYWLFTGTATQTYSSTINDLAPQWTDAMRYTAYIVTYMRMDNNNPQYQGLPKRGIVVKGRLLYDPRDNSTAYSTNIALAALDWLTNGRYGMGISMSKFNIDSFKSAANYCDTKTWEVNMGISKQDRKIDILNEILSLMRGGLVWNPEGGQYYLKYADLSYESSVMTINDEHILQDKSGIAGINIGQGSGLQKTVGYNVVFIDPEKQFTTDKIPIGDTMGKVEDLKLLGCTDRQQAADLGVYYLERQLLDRVINITVRDDCVELEPHDLITLNSTALSISDQLMRVIEADIRQDGLVQLSLQYESSLLYDDDYNLDLDNVYEVDIPDPSDEPPGVTNVSIEEEVYQYRLRSESRFLISFTPPDYVWFSHVEVWQSFDDLTWVYLFDVQDDFQVGPLEEGQTYYFRLKVVSTRNNKQQDNNDWKISKFATGQSSTLPPSLTTLYAIVNRNNGVTLFSQKIWDDDIEVYEFRLGSSWSGAIFLASLRSPNLVYNLVKPGQHTFWCNTLGANGLYGANPVSVQVTLSDPPDDYTVQQTYVFVNLVTNGDMELDSNWTDVGTPDANRTSEKKHSDNYSWKFDANASFEGIRSDNFTTISGRKYGVGLWVWPDDTTTVHVRIRNGANTGYLWNYEVTDLTQQQWNEIIITDVQEGGVSGGNGAYIEILSPSGTSSTKNWYVDDVVIVEGDFSDNVGPVLYSGDAFIKCKHAGDVLTGTWHSPEVDLGGLDKYLVYAISDLIIVGQGTLWSNQVPSPTKWSGVNVTTQKWREIFELTSAPSVEMTLNYGSTSPPTSEMKKLEILGAVISGRYFKLAIEITDPQSQVFAYVEGPNLKFAQ